MIAGVRAAVTDGLSAEQTVEAVKLEQFQGYALWGWIHEQVNVPMTHAELAK